MNAELQARLAALSPEKRALLMKRLEKTQPAAAPALLPSREPGRTHFPLSFAQQTMWLMEHLEGEAAAGNIPMAWLLRGHLRLDALRAAFQRLVDRHEPLRTAFPHVEGEPQQVVQASAQLDIPLTDIGHLAETEREAERNRLAQAEAQRPFDLAQAPLLRVSVVRCADEEHLVLVSLHHLITDGWSSGVFVGEFVAAYTAAVTGEPWQPAPLPLQYADYALHQREHAVTGLKPHLDYWLTQLAGAPAYLKVAADKERPPRQSYRGQVTPFQWPQELVDALKQLSRRHDTTLFMTLLAAFKALLFRYSNNEDILIGTPIAGRRERAYEGLMGLFANTLVMRTQVSPDLRFSQLLAEVKRITLEAYEHQAVPFEYLLEELRPRRSMAHAPLFQMMLVLQNAPKSDVVLPDLSVEPFWRGNTAAKLDLSLTLTEIEDGMWGELEYNTDIFTPDTIERVIQHLGALLREVVADPEQRLARIRFLSKDEERNMALFLGDEVPYPFRCVPNFILDRCEGSGKDRPALISAAGTLTYSQLQAPINNLCAQLQEQGVGSEDAVAIYLERGPTMVIAMLAVLKAGAQYIPLDPFYPKQRIKHVVDDAQPRWALTEPALADDLPAQIVKLDAAALMRRPGTPREVVIDPRQLAYTIYTSGSTGRPKGVAIQHDGLTNLFFGAMRDCQINSLTCLLAVTSVSFDITVLDFFVTLSAGGCVVIADRQDMLDGARQLDWIRRAGVNTIQATPAYWRLLMDSLGDADLKQVRAFVGGEALNAPLGRLLTAKTQEVHNLYGPTEATVWLSSMPSRGRFPMNLGMPFPNLRMLILDSAMNPLPGGATGELYIGGICLARGYAGNPAETASRFVPDPYSDKPGQRLFRTGDLVSYEKGQGLIFHGRADFQVKVRGFRIELGEIESRLTAHTFIREAVCGVVGGGQDEAETRLVAWYCAEFTIADAELRQWVAQHLPDYMVPSQFVALDAMPLTPNLKVDRKALPLPEHETVASLIAEPQNPLEHALLRLWRDVLKRESLGVNEDFFRLGGNSLKATRFVYRLKLEHDIDMPVHLLFETLTIEKLAAKLAAQFPKAASLNVVEKAVIDRAQISAWLAQCWRELLADETLSGNEHFFVAGGDSLSGLQLAARVQERFGIHLPLETLFANPDGDALSRWLEEQCGAGHGNQRNHATAVAEEPPSSREILMSKNQRRLWLLERLEVGGPAYHISRLVHIDGRLNPDHLRAALALVAQRHESLRTTFSESEGQGYQKIHPHLPITWDQVDLGLLAEPTQALYEQARTHAEPAFDLQTGPLWRACLFQVTPQRHTLLLVLHHLIADGWSLNVLHNDLWQAYKTVAAGLPAGAAVAPHAVVEDPYDAAAEAAWWRDTLADLPPLLELPTDFPRPAALGQAGAWVQARLSRETVTGLERLAVANGATLYMALLTCYQLLLARYCRRRDIVTATPVANRITAAAEQTVGCLVNTLPIRADINQNQSFQDLLAHVRDQTLAAFAHQNLPFEQVVAALNPPRNRSHAPLVQAMLVLDRGRAVATPAGISSRLEVLRLPFAQFELQLHIHRDNDSAQLTFVYNRELFAAQTIGRLADHFCELTAAALRQPRLPACRLSMTTAPEQQRLAAWARPQAQTWPTSDVAAAVIAAAQATPLAPALIDGETTLDYASLLAHASRLAFFLQAETNAAAGPIALLCERNATTVVAQVACLLAGRPWLALDPELPPQRLSNMLADSGAALLLTNGSRLADLPAGAPPAYALDAETPAWRQAPSTPPAVDYSAAAYVLFTSGSTGRPKAVCVPRDALHNRIAWMQAQFQLGAEEAVLHKTPFSFDVSIWEWLWPLMQGARVVIAPPHSQRDNHQLIDLIQQHQITTVHFVPPMLHAFLETPAAAACHSLRRMIASGEALTAATVRLCRERLHTGLYNLYGPTEAAIDVSCWDATCSDAEDPLPIGKAIHNVSLLVRDDWGYEVPVGVPGELYIGGAALGLGYVGRADLTAERFVPNPYGDVAGARLYRTGDIVKRREDGNLVYLGRRDHQVKWNGLRIELGEIEHALRALPDVQQAVAILAQSEGGHRELVAYVTGACQPEPLQAALVKVLPQHMVPRQIMVLDQLPLTRNGKIDRRALPAPNRVSHAAFRAPQGETEHALAKLWQTLLGHEPVGRDDDFFRLGGHSLTVARLGAQIDAFFGVALTMRQLFNNAQLHRMAELIDNQVWLLESRTRTSDAVEDLEMGEL